MAEPPDRDAAEAPRLRREPGLAALVAHANHLVAGHFEARAKRLGLPVTVARILAALGRGDQLDMTELARLLLLQQPTLTKAIDRLETARLVRRSPDPEDGRRTLVRLTARGRRRAAVLARYAREEELALRQMLGEEAAHTLATALLRLINHVTPPPHRPRRLPCHSFAVSRREPACACETGA
jgi:DNA-binding MarR family transcriptional regulator